MTPGLKILTDLLEKTVRYAVFALLIFTPLARGAVQGWAVTTIHITLLIALTAFLLEKSLTENRKWPPTPLDKPILALLGLCLISFSFSNLHGISFWAMWLFVDYCIIFYLFIHLIRYRSHLKQLVYLVMGIACFLCVFGLVKQSGANPFPWWEYPELGVKDFRMASTYGNANHLAGYLEMAIPLLMGLWLREFRGPKRFVMIGLALLFLTVLLFSLSRGGWIGAIVGLGFMSFALTYPKRFKKQKRLYLLTAGVLAALVIVIVNTPVTERVTTLYEAETEPSFGSRVEVWGGLLEMIWDHPLWGAGPGTFATIFTQYQPPGYLSRFFMGHNDYLHFTSELGIPLLAIVIWMMIIFYKTGFKKLKNPSRLVRGTTAGAMAGVTAILVHSISDFNLHIPANALLFTLLAALVVGPLPRQNRR
ncbi:O-antigen ligase family protein [Thermodesulfobacteriota bacterium]